MPAINTFGPYMKAVFGSAVHKVNIDAGFTCPNRDGTVAVGGCIYCNNESFKPGACRPHMPVANQVENGITYLKGRFKAKKFLAYFQPYTNTYAPVEKLKALYNEALSRPDVIGIAIGTRPDCIDEEKLDLLADINRTRFVLVEYGLQSIYEDTLKFINRGHGYAEFLKAVKATNQRGIRTGAHIIVGFPTETRRRMLDMAHEVSHTGIGFLKIHQLQVVEGTPLAFMYRKSPFYTFSYSDYLNFAVEFLERLSPEIVIQRLFATAPDDLLVAPRWDMSKNKILNDIVKLMDSRGTHQGRLAREFANVG